MEDDTEKGRGRSEPNDLVIGDQTQKEVIEKMERFQAGLPYTSEQVTRDDVVDWRRMSKYFEDAVPIWPPGTKTGYHALTVAKVVESIGGRAEECRFLMYQVVRRLDDRQRGIVDILGEIVSKYGKMVGGQGGDRSGLVDNFIGLPNRCSNNRVALLRPTTEEDVEQEKRHNLEAYRRYMAYNREYHNNLYDTWPWITTDDVGRTPPLSDSGFQYNLLENRLLPMPSNMGLGNAKGLAAFHSLLAQRTIISYSFYEKYLTEPVLEEEMDVTNGYPESKGYGYQWTRNPKVRRAKWRGDDAV